MIQKFDPAQMPVLSLVVRPDAAHAGMSGRELTMVADEFLKRRIENVPGVGKAEVVGGSTRDILVQVDPLKLEALGLTLPQVANALGQDTQSVPSGSLLTDTREIGVRVDAKARQVQDFDHVVVGNKQGRPIELREAATLVDGVKEKRTLARLDGKDAVAIEVQKQIGGNTVAMVQNVEKVLARLAPELAQKGVTIVTAKDNSKFIKDSVDDVETSIILGGLLTVVIVFFFLGSWRSTIITSLTLPVSVISTFVIMKALDFTLNTMTLMALSLAIGILIDDAIVVRENITRHAEMGKDHVTAAREGTAEIGSAVIATTLSILAVFIPVAFMGGIVGRFFFSFGIVVAFAVAMSLFVSFTLDPMLSAVWPDPEHEKGFQESHHGRRRFVMKAVDRFNDWLGAWEAFYRRAIAWALDYRWTVLLTGAGSFALAMVLMGMLGGDFMPDYDRGDFQVGFKVEAGASLQAAQRKAEELEAVLRTRPDGRPSAEVEHVYTTIGTGLNGTITQGTIYVQLADRHRRGLVPIRREVRSRLRGIAGVETDVSAVTEFGESKPVNLAILSPDRRVVEQAEPLVVEAMRGVDGAVDITSSRDKGRPELRLAVDRRRASDLGVSPMAVASLVRPLVDGVDVAKVRGPGHRRAVRRDRAPVGPGPFPGRPAADHDRELHQEGQERPQSPGEAGQRGPVRGDHRPGQAGAAGPADPGPGHRQQGGPDPERGDRRRHPPGGAAAPGRHPARRRPAGVGGLGPGQQGDRRLHGHGHAPGGVLHLLRAGQPVRELQAAHHHHAQPAPVHGGHGADAAGHRGRHEHDDQHRHHPAHGPGHQECHPAGGPGPAEHARARHVPAGGPDRGGHRPVAPHPHDQLRHGGRHAAPVPGPGRRRPAAGAHGPGGGGGHHHLDDADPDRDPGVLRPAGPALLAAGGGTAAASAGGDSPGRAVET